MSSAGNFLSEVINHTIRNIRTNIVPNLEEENNEAWKTWKMLKADWDIQRQKLMVLNTAFFGFLTKLEL